MSDKYVWVVFEYYGSRIASIHKTKESALEEQKKYNNFYAKCIRGSDVKNYQEYYGMISDVRKEVLHD